jgi:hypothetical protein
MSEPALFGEDIFGDPIEQPSRGAVADNFLASPFTVLDARQGWWQDRKRAWISLGIQSEKGRGEGGKCMPEGGMSLSAKYKAKEAEKLVAKDGLIFPKACGMDFYRDKTKAEQKQGAQAGLTLAASSSTQFYRDKTEMEQQLGRKLTAEEFAPMYEPRSAADLGTSIFDPVICECAYKWWCPPGGQIIDPFAGGSVRGIVAEQLGFQYWGSELRPEQVESNREQGEKICDPFNQPEWWCGDALQAEPPQGDMIIGCPPYGDLEVYSDLPEDLSNMTYAKFLEAYRAIIKRFCAQLKNNRFAVWVIGEIRDPKTGLYRNFVGDTTQAFLDAGLGYYNEAILVTMVGSASLRVTRQFNAGRKLCKCHQNVLIYVKGDGKLAAEACNQNQPKP